jgi:hypothetical protein
MFFGVRSFSVDFTDGDGFTKLILSSAAQSQAQTRYKRLNDLVAKKTDRKKDNTPAISKKLVVHNKTFKWSQSDEMRTLSSYRIHIIWTHNLP